MDTMKFMMQIADLTARQSSSEGTKVGAVLEKEGRVLAIGYNGTLPGKSNKCESFICQCGNEAQIYPETTCCACLNIGKWAPNNQVIHAEQNVIAFAAKFGIPTLGCTMYTTLSPCDTCAKLLIQAGIFKVVFAKYWKDQTGLDILVESGVKVCKYDIDTNRTFPYGG